MKIFFQNKGKDPHTFFDKRNIIKTTKTCFYCKISHLIKDCNKIIATKATSRKQQSNNIITHNENLYVVASNSDFFPLNHQQ
jgi:hypothetical protein